MTFTQTYIEMMKESPLQKEKKYLDFGNWYAVNLAGDFPPIIRLCRKDKSWKSSSTIWLPTSDDWWEMIDSQNCSFEGHSISGIWSGRFALGSNPISQWFFGSSYLELISTFWHHERGLRWDKERGEWTK